jgi:hypothetical protein
MQRVARQYDHLDNTERVRKSLLHEVAAATRSENICTMKVSKRSDVLKIETGKDCAQCLPHSPITTLNTGQQIQSTHIITTATSASSSVSDSVLL